MIRKLILWLFIAVLPMQGTLAATHVLLIPADQGLAHWHDHDQGVPHYHDDQGQVHYDESSVSQDHVDDHLGCHLSAIPMGAQALSALLSFSQAPPLETPSVFPDPFLDQPQRPPHAPA